MKQFKYEAKKGMDLVKGILSAETKDEAIDKINEMGLIPVELEEEISVEPDSPVLGRTGSFSSKISARALNVFYRQLSRLLKSGVPLLPALALISEQFEDPKLQKILEQIKNQVRQGKSFAEVMAGYPSVFNAFAVSMVELGENTGHLDEALQRLADCYERQLVTVQKIRNALLYPAFIISLGGFAVVFLLAYVVPKFTKLFSELGQTLPLLTRCLIWVSDVAKHSGLGIIFAVAVFMILMRARLRVRSNKIHWDKIKLQLPLLGKVIFMAQFAAFSRSVEMLLRGGVTLLKAMRTAVPSVSNEAMKEELIHVANKVEQGATLSEALKASGFFPMFAIHLLLIGEKTGRLEQSFNDIADWYEQEVEENTRILTQLIEPIAILVLGIALGLIAMAILLPIFSMDAIIS
ncbi:MAG TPA: type II secretion system F family protein [Candidatus Omnitrophota bacterium]|nr:type II secretion system F family protein [Candidatus Omnitrophota bacterium]